MANATQPDHAAALDRARQLLYQALARPYRDVLSLPGPPRTVQATQDTMHSSKSTAPNRQVLFRYMAQLCAEPSFLDAHTVVVLADNRDPKHAHLEYMQYTFRMLLERCSQVLNERWTVLFVPLNATTGLAGVHYTWGATYALEVLAAIAPQKHIILMDNDAAPTTLWEVADLQKLASQEGYASPALAHVFSEHVSYVNAGIMVFPAEASVAAHATPVSSYEAYHALRTQTLRRIMSFIPDDLPPDAELRHPYLQANQNTWARRPFHGTPLEFMTADCRFDLCAIWAHLGDLMNAIGFLQDAQPGGLKYRKCLDWSRLTHPQREHICRWAGVTFEQGAFAVLTFVFAIHGKIIVWPGQVGFMLEKLSGKHAGTAKIRVCQQESHLKPAPPINVHGWSPKGKSQLAALKEVTHWRTMRQSLFGAPDSRPCYASRPSFHVSRGLKIVIQTPMPPYSDHGEMAHEIRHLAAFQVDTRHPVMFLSTSVAQFLERWPFLHDDKRVPIQNPTSQEAEEAVHDMEERQLSWSPADTRLFVSATGLGGRVTSLQRPDVIIANAGMHYGSTWAECEAIINEYNWHTKQGINQLSADMYYLLHEPYVQQVWRELLQQQGLGGIRIASFEIEPPSCSPCPAHLTVCATDAILGLSLWLKSLRATPLFTGRDNEHSFPRRRLITFHAFSAGTSTLIPFLAAGDVLTPRYNLEVLEVVLGGIATIPEAVLRLLPHQCIRWVHIAQDTLCKVDVVPFVQALLAGTQPQKNVSVFTVEDFTGPARGLGRECHTYDHLLDVPDLPVIAWFSNRGTNLVSFDKAVQNTPLAPVAERIGYLMAYGLYQVMHDEATSKLQRALMTLQSEPCRMQVLLETVAGQPSVAPVRACNGQAQEGFPTQRGPVMDEACLVGTAGSAAPKAEVQPAAQTNSRVALAAELGKLCRMLPVLWRSYLLGTLLPGLLADPAASKGVKLQRALTSQVYEEHPEAPNTHAVVAEPYAALLGASATQVLGPLMQEISLGFHKVQWAIWDGHVAPNQRGRSDHPTAAVGVSAGDVLHLRLLGAQEHGKVPDASKLDLILMVTYQDAYSIRMVDEKSERRNRVDPTMPHVINAIVAHASCPGDAQVNIDFHTYRHLLPGAQGACCFALQKGAVAPFFFQRIARITPWQLALHSGHDDAMTKAEVACADGYLMDTFLRRFQRLVRGRAEHRRLQGLVPSNAEGACLVGTASHRLEGHSSAQPPSPAETLPPNSEPDSGQATPRHWYQAPSVAKYGEWDLLYEAAPHFAESRAKQRADQRRVLEIIIRRLAADHKRGGKLGYLQGMPGSGKTMMMLHFMLLMAHFECGPLLWVARDNAPLISAGGYIAKLLPEGSNPLRDKVVRVPSSSVPLEHPFDVSVEDRRTLKDKPKLQLMVVTTGSLQADSQRLFPFFTKWHRTNFLIFDEAQGFGKAEDIIAALLLRPEGMMMLIGDPQQPVGASPHKLMQRYIRQVTARKVGLRSARVRHLNPEKVTSQLLQACAATSLDDLYDVLLSTTTVPHDDNAAALIDQSPEDSWAGWPALDFSYRLHPLVYMALLHLFYGHLLSGRDTLEQCLGFIPPGVHTMVDDGLRSVLWKRQSSSTSGQAGAADSTSSGSSPAESSTALSIPVYLDTHELDSHAPFDSQAWPLLVGILAEVAAQVGSQVTRQEPIGVILCFLDHLSPFVSKLKEKGAKQATDARLTLAQMVLSERKKPSPAPLTAEEFARHLVTRPHMWRPYIRESTAINGAGSDFNFVICYAPRLNRLTNDTAAAIVSYSRHKKLLIFMANQQSANS